jgi:fermentation-respiration switch protein FrsA (DUF1100 family)
MMVRTVSFRNKAVALAAHLHLPDDFSEDEKYPALVGIHPAGGVKEQTIGTYAAKLAAQGFVTVVYDSSYQGESGGEPRLLEDPTTRVEDACCAADSSPRCRSSTPTGWVSSASAPAAATPSAWRRPSAASRR